MYKSVFVWVVLLALLPVGLLARPASAAPAAQAADERCFDATGYCISGPIGAFWEQHGGLPVFGYPISPQQEQRIAGTPRTVQWFERYRLELHPENEPPYNVLSGRLGIELLAQQGRDWTQFAAATPPIDENCLTFAETPHAICGRLLEAWRANGLEQDGQPGLSVAESTALFGLPISQVMTETIDGVDYQVQWFERARFELHPENAPPFDVQLGLLGRALYAADESGVWAALVAGNTTFAFDLYSALRTQEGNLFYSPYSISAALAMAYAGASGVTADEMAATLHLPTPTSRVHPAFGALNAALTTSEDTAQEDDPIFRLRVANALWGQQGYSFLEDFLATLEQHYDAPLREVDFAAQPDAARTAINQWVSDQTEERIQDIVPPGAITPLTRLVLANAIYFQADWVHPFAAETTSDGDFFRLDGSTVSVPLMRQTTTFAHMAGEDYQAVALPYEGGTQMIILLPAAGMFAPFDERLDATLVTQTIAELAPRRVALTMPKWQFTTELGLTQVLSELGMPSAFAPQQANFSAMDGTRELFISDVLHKAFVAVDEQGTEAAAATTVVVGTTSAQPEPVVQFRADRPFVFLIHDPDTDSVLFVGRVLDPAI